MKHFNRSARAGVKQAEFLDETAQKTKRIKFSLTSRLYIFLLAKGQLKKIKCMLH